MNTSTAINHRMTFDDALCRHGHLDVFSESRGMLVADCEVGGERCFSFAPTSSREALEQRFIEHAADELGICWACSHSTALLGEEWPNRRNCERCWLMYHAEVEHLWPRDCPPFPKPGPASNQEAD